MAALATREQAIQELVAAALAVLGARQGREPWLRLRKAVASVQDLRSPAETGDEDR